MVLTSTTYIKEEFEIAFIINYKLGCQLTFLNHFILNYRLAFFLYDMIGINSI